jgi:hypothetical protein
VHVQNKNSAASEETALNSVMRYFSEPAPRPAADLICFRISVEKAARIKAAAMREGIRESGPFCRELVEGAFEHYEDATSLILLKRASLETPRLDARWLERKKGAYLHKEVSHEETALLGLVLARKTYEDRSAAARLLTDGRDSSGNVPKTSELDGRGVRERRAEKTPIQ